MIGDAGIRCRLSSHQKVICVLRRNLSDYCTRIHYWRWSQVTQGCSSTEEEKVKQLTKRIQQLEAEVARLRAKLIGMWGEA